MKLALIAAVGGNNVIGKGGKIPWHLSADLRRFKELTMGHPIIMGRKTFESIGKPLPGRRNIVISGAPDFKAEGCLVAHSFGEALRMADGMGQGEAGVFVVGGARVYAEALPSADTIYLTKIDGSFEGDAFFPGIDEREWELISSEEHKKDEDNPYRYEFLVYERKR